jgi:prophage regulatory protein
MDFQRSGSSPEMILRLRDVLKRTGLSRSTLYNRIANGEFPHQISLGGRAIGWFKGEVQDWINERVRLRPQPGGASENASEEGNAIGKGVGTGTWAIQRSTEPPGCVVSVNDGSPDPAQLHLVGTKVYFDRNSGSFWLKLLPEVSANQTLPRGRTRGLVDR